MKWQGTTWQEQEARRAELKEWRPAFAFLPHKTAEGKWLWLERAEKHLDTIGIFGSYFFAWRERGEARP